MGIKAIFSPSPANGGFYWNRLIPDGTPQKQIKPDLYPAVPKVWNQYRINGKTLPGFGYGTYALKVFGAQKGQALTLWIPTFSTAYRLYIDGQLMAENGTVSVQPANGQPQYRPTLITFTPKSSAFRINVEVSNYIYARGGMWNAMYLGSPGKMYGMERGILCRDLFFLGSFFVTAFIYCSLYLFRRKEKANLFFAVLCVIAIFRTLFHSSYFINTLMPFLPFPAIIRLDYLAIYWLPIMLACLLREFFREEVGGWMIKISLIYALFMTVLTLLTPVSFFTNLVYFAEFVILLIAFYLLFKLNISVWRGRPHAALILIGSLSLWFCSVYDALYQSNLITVGLFELTPIGCFIMLMVQAHVLAESFVETIKKEEQALSDLRITAERERKMELKFLQSQIRPHFIHNAINAILSISRKNVPRAQELLVEFSNYLRGCFQFRDLEDVIPLSGELEFVRSYILLEQARFGDKLRVTYDIEDDSILVPPLILQPIVENAVIHGIRPKPDGGSILIYVKCEENTVRIGVKDDGVGIEPEKISLLLLGGEVGKSVGIQNINQRLNRMYGKSLHIEGRDTGGLDVYMELPRNGKPDAVRVAQTDRCSPMR